MAETPSQPALRKFVESMLVTDSDLEAFCLDYFPDVKRRFSAGMDRVQKVNLLFSHGDPAQIVEYLQEMDPKRAARFVSLLSEPAPRPAAAPATPAAPAAQAPPAAAGPDPIELLDALMTLTLEAFDEVVFRVRIRSNELPGRSSTQRERAMQLIERLEMLEGERGLTKLVGAIQKVSPNSLAK